MTTAFMCHCCRPLMRPLLDDHASVAIDQHATCEGTFRTASCVPGLTHFQWCTYALDERPKYSGSGILLLSRTWLCVRLSAASISASCGVKSWYAANVSTLKIRIRAAARRPRESLRSASVFTLEASVLAVWRVSTSIISAYLAPCWDSLRVGRIHFEEELASPEREITSQALCKFVHGRVRFCAAVDFDKY